MTDSSQSRPAYRGRFAPSPTGPLHLGSLIAATGSYLAARHQNGQWQVRIEDIDPPREMPGASDDILRTLERFGFEWDGEIIYQRHRQAIYEEYLQQLVRNQQSYPCTCSRKDIASRQPAGAPVQLYPGTCRGRKTTPAGQFAYRLMVENRELHFFDAIQGQQHWQLAEDIGDFVIRRADGLYSYQLAVAIDDGSMGITDVVRGADLLESTPRQIYLQQQLGLTTPGYAHLPVATNAAGQKLSKQTFAAALDVHCPVPQIWHVLEMLGQSPPAELLQASLAETWRWAVTNWQPAAIPRGPLRVEHGHGEL